MMSILLAIVTGGGLGYVIERGDFCFHSTWRGLWRRPPQLDLMRAYGLALLVGVPLVQALIWLGWVDPWVPPFAWPANLIGGFIFGLGMVVAATCITGLFYKLGHGMLGTLVGLLFWAVGDVLTYLGPLAPLRAALNAAPLSVNGQSATVTNSLGAAGVGLLVVLAAAAVYTLRRSPVGDRSRLWSWPRLGLAVGLTLSLAWLLARAGGANYTFGTSGVPSGLWQMLTSAAGGGNVWIPVTLISLIPGAFVAAWRSGTLWVRGETARRYVELAGGGLLMGVGAGLAGGCNLGHSLVGVPLLSLGSIVSTLAMGLGVYVAHRAGQVWRASRVAPAGAAA